MTFQAPTRPLLPCHYCTGPSTNDGQARRSLEFNDRRGLPWLAVAWDGFQCRGLPWFAIACRGFPWLVVVSRDLP
jgi:hypothetical protein